MGFRTLGAIRRIRSATFNLQLLYGTGPVGHNLNRVKLLHRFSPTQPKPTSTPAASDDTSRSLSPPASTPLPSPSPTHRHRPPTRRYTASTGFSAPRPVARGRRPPLPLPLPPHPRRRSPRRPRTAAARARRIASHLSLLSSRGAWALGWDYLRHYAFSSTAGCGLSCATAAARLLATVAEASRLQSTADAAQWLRRNYSDLQAAAAQLLTGLLAAFSEQGPLREVVLDVKWEVEERELLKDCLQVGAKDLEGLLVIAKDLIFGASRASSHHTEF